MPKVDETLSAIVLQSQELRSRALGQGWLPCIASRFGLWYEAVLKSVSRTPYCPRDHAAPTPLLNYGALHFKQVYVRLGR